MVETQIRRQREPKRGKERGRKIERAREKRERDILRSMV